MGGFGSGGHNAKGRGTVEGCRSLDVNELNRRGALTPGTVCTVTWTSGTNIGVRAAR